MKSFSYKAKSALALVLAMSLCSTTAFAAGTVEANKVEAPLEITAENGLPTLTYAEALAKARKNNPQARDVKDAMDFYMETESNFYDRVGDVDLPNYDFRTWADTYEYALNTQAFDIENKIKQTSLQGKLVELGTEVFVKTYFTSIKQNEEALELTKKSTELNEKLYKQGQARYNLGLLSQYNLDQLKLAWDQSKAQVELLKVTLEQEYIKLNNLMGEKTDARFNYVYDYTFEPYEMKRSMEQYLNDKIKNDLNIQLQELKYDSAKFYRNYVSWDNLSMRDTYELNYTTARRAYAKAKEDKELAIRNTLLQIQQLETSYETAAMALAKAEADYRVAQVSFQAGAKPAITVEQAALGVLKARNDLNKIVYNHDMLIFMFENPSVLSTGSNASQQ